MCLYDFNILTHNPLYWYLMTTRKSLKLVFVYLYDFGWVFWVFSI